MKDDTNEENLEKNKRQLEKNEEKLKLDDTFPRKRIRITLTTWIKFFVVFCMLAMLTVVLIAYNVSTDDNISIVNNGKNNVNKIENMFVSFTAVDNVNK